MEEVPIGFTIVVKADFTIRFNDTIAPTAIAADKMIRAIAAFLRHIQRGLNEGLRSGATEQFGKAVLPHCAELPFIEHIEIAGVNAAIPLHDKLNRAARSCCRIPADGP